MSWPPLLPLQLMERHLPEGIHILNTNFRRRCILEVAVFLQVTADESQVGKVAESQSLGVLKGHVDVVLRGTAWCWVKDWSHS